MDIELKVGQKWKGKLSDTEKEIVFIGSSSVMWKGQTGEEHAYKLSHFHEDHHLLPDVKELIAEDLMKDIEYLTDAIQDSRLAIIRSDEIRKKYNLK